MINNPESISAIVDLINTLINAVPIIAALFIVIERRYKVIAKLVDMLLAKPAPQPAATNGNGVYAQLATLALKGQGDSIELLRRDFTELRRDLDKTSDRVEVLEQLVFRKSNSE